MRLLQKIVLQGTYAKISHGPKNIRCVVEDKLVRFVTSNHGVVDTSQLSLLYKLDPWLKRVGPLEHFCQSTSTLKFVRGGRKKSRVYLISEEGGTPRKEAEEEGGRRKGDGEEAEGTGGRRKGDRKTGGRATTKRHDAKDYAKLLLLHAMSYEKLISSASARRARRDAGRSRRKSSGCGESDRKDNAEDTQSLACSVVLYVVNSFL